MASLHPNLDRLLTESYLDGIADVSLDVLRSKRAECQEAEVTLSYLRRLTQGRLDIVQSFLDRSDGRGDQGELNLAALVNDLPDILSTGPSRPPGPGRLPLLLAPDTEDPDLTRALDDVLGADQITQLGSMDTTELHRIADGLVEFEQRVSTERRALHERIDTLQAELVSRYKTGAASVNGLLS